MNNNLNQHYSSNLPETDESPTSSPEGGPTVIQLDRFSDGDYITKAGMTQVFDCSERTIQRMVERFEIPPPSTVAGRKVWRVGKLKAWLAQADDRTEAEAIREAKRLRVL